MSEIQMKMKESKRSLQIFIPILVMCLSLIGCSSQSATEQNATKVLNEAMKKSMAQETFNIEEKLNEFALDKYSTKGKVSQIRNNSISTTKVKKNDDKFYSFSTTKNDKDIDYMLLFSIVDYQRKEILADCTNQPYGKGTLLNFDTYTVDNLNHLYLIELILDNQDCYEFSLESNENDGGKTINIKCIDTEKLLEQEIKRIRKADADYDPLTTYTGYHFKKYERNQDDYKVIISEDGMITELTIWKRNDYGEGLFEETKQIFNYSYEENSLNTDAIDTLITKAEDYGIVEDDSFDWSDVI